MFSHLSPGLRAGQSEMVVLQSVNVEVVFHNLLCETVLTQTEIGRLRGHFQYINQANKYRNI